MLYAVFWEELDAEVGELLRKTATRCLSGGLDRVPILETPDLDALIQAYDGHIRVYTGILPQELRQNRTPLTIKREVYGSRVEQTAEGADIRLGLGQPADFLG